MADLTAAPAAIERARESAPKRLSKLPSVELGKQVVGSRRQVLLVAPVNRDEAAGPAMAAVSISGSPDISFRWPPMSALQPNEVAAPIELEFEPTQRGEHRAALVFAARWADGQIEQQRVDVHGSARMLTDVPEPNATKPPIGAPSSSPAAPRDPNGTYTKQESDSLQLAGRHLDRAIAGVFEHQKLGVERVEKYQSEYVRVKPVRSIWWDLAEVALEIGVTAFASYFAPIVEAKLVAAGLEALESGAGEAVAHGIEHTLVKQIEKVAKGHLEPENEKESTHPLADFFLGQKSALVDASGKVTDETSTKEFSLRRLFQSDPAKAVAAIDSLGDAFDEAGKKAEGAQAHATSLQLIAFKARLELGTETVATKIGERPATRLDQVRESQHGKLGDPSNSDGLIDIRVQLGSNNKPKVTGARVTGVSPALLDELLEQDLSKASLPVRLIVDGCGYITRDELGRVRWAGALRLEHWDGFANEAAQATDAERLASEVLAKSLKAWGISKIENDDAGNEKERKE